jgi:immune inhibitor A
MLFTDEGITERVRTDLTGPDGKPGFDISGYTMKNMYEEMSRGAYSLSGEATEWVSVPHSEGYYGATVCHRNDAGEWEAGPMQDMQGHPDNPLGPGQLPIDAVAAVAGPHVAQSQPSRAHSDSPCVPCAIQSSQMPKLSVPWR